MLFAVSVSYKYINKSFAFSPTKSCRQLEKLEVDFFQNVYCLFLCNFVRIGQLDFPKRGIDLSLLTLLSTNSVAYVCSLSIPFRHLHMQETHF